MQTGVYSAQKKDGTVYYRANITYQTKHISLGSFSSEEDAHSAYLEACNLLENEAVTLFNIHSQIRHLSFDKAVCLLNFRDNHLYFHNPIYLRKGYFSYFLSDDMELKFDIDDLFYYAGHRIQKRQGHLFVSDYGMQYSILSRYGIKPYAVTGRDYLFFNGDTHDFRYSNILNINRYHGVFSYEKNGATHYKVFIHINGNYKIGSYASEASAAVAYNKAADLAKTFGVTKQFPENYVDTLNPREYAELYTMQYLASVMGMAAGNSAQDIAHFIYYRKFLVLIIYHRFSYYKVPYSSE